MTEMLNNLIEMREVDEQGMLNVVGRFDTQLQEAVEIGQSVSVSRDWSSVDNVVICGLGGSAIGGDFIRAYLGKSLRVPLFVNRGYSVPGFAGPNTLAIMSSYSGNTEETLSALKEAIAAKAKILCISSNGQLQREAEQYRFPLIRIPGGYPPRTAIGYSAIPVLMVLGKLGLAPDPADEIRRSVGWVRRKIQLYGPTCPLAENAAKTLARQLHRRIPVIYGSQDRLDVLAVRWRGQFSENGKQLAYSASLPEMNHNEIVGWKHPAAILRQILPIFLRDREDHPRVQIRAEITRDILSEKAGSALEFWTDSESWLERLWTLVLLGDYASVYLSFLNQEDPTPVEAIEGLKNRLKESS